MNFIREMVSQKKIRFKDNQFNLDLTYITPRVIAMAYPASGMESLYRNKMQDVCEFLDSRHPNKYYVINTSSRKYDYSKFHNKVIDIDWPNHHPCRFFYFCKIVLETAKLLMDSDPETVVVVHCLGGKGRTGSLIGCLLSLTGVIPSILGANHFYKQKRGVNVTYPSQIRYMVQFRYYFLFGKKAIDFSQKTLTSVSIKSSQDSFFESSIFNLTFSDYKEKDKILYERSFEALFQKDLDKSAKEVESKESIKTSQVTKEKQRVRLSSVDRKIPNLADLKLDEEEAEESDEETPVRKINHLDTDRLSIANTSSKNISKIKSLKKSEFHAKLTKS